MLFGLVWFGAYFVCRYFGPFFLGLWLWVGSGAEVGEETEGVIGVLILSGSGGLSFQSPKYKYETLLKRDYFGCSFGLGWGKNPVIV